VPGYVLAYSGDKQSTVLGLADHVVIPCWQLMLLTLIASLVRPYHGGRKLLNFL
jgi:hypothetical protein